MRALISLGSNTSRFLVVRDLPGGDIETVEHDQIGTRLGEGLRDGGAFAPAAIDRNLAAVAAFASRARALGAPLAVIATSAMRRAGDADAFAARVAAVAGVPLEVIDGRREAEASYRGATYGADLGPERVAVLDIGGGSTECAAGANGAIDVAQSFEIGSVRVAERYPALTGATPGTQARAAAKTARADIAGVIAALLAFAPVGQLRCVAGTPLTIAAVAYGSHVDRVSGVRLPLTVLDATIERLLDLDLAQRRALPGMLAQRADVLAAGALILSECFRALGMTTGVLEVNDLLLGYLLLTREGVA